MPDVIEKVSETGFWSRVVTIVAVINPVLVLVVGFILNRGIVSSNQQIEAAKLRIEENQAQIQDMKTAADKARVDVGIQVDKVKVIQDFLDALTGPNETRRKIAIEAIFIVLPDEAPRLVSAIQDSPNTKDAVAAKAALERTRTQLLTDMFSEDRPTRANALRSLQRGWNDDPNVIGRLIDRAMQDVEARRSSGWKPPTTAQATQQLASISNIAAFLSTANIFGQELRARAAKFAEAAAANSADTRRYAALIQDRLRT
jgi:hypothetical protein